MGTNEARIGTNGQEWATNVRAGMAGSKIYGDTLYSSRARQRGGSSSLSKVGGMAACPASRR